MMLEKEHGGKSKLFDPPGMPSNQVNAHLSDELMMRVGIPHRGGRLSYHAFEQDFPVMVSAAAFWDQASSRFRIPEATNLTELNVALDSAGFTAMANWKAKGPQPGMARIFPWGYAQYLELASLLNPAWFSAPDLCVEPEICRSQEEIDYRIDATATLLEGTLRIVYAWQNELAKECSPSTVASMVRPPVPILQGWSSTDYLRCLDLIMQVWRRWEPWIAPPKLIGVGSVCRRTLHHPKHGLHAILAGLEGNLPSQARLHLFGVKGTCLQDLKMLDWVASADSMAWDYSARLKAHREGHSNTMQHRSKEMSQWMANAYERIKPSAGDQFRLSLYA